jgi:hypothetical protein
MQPVLGLRRQNARDLRQSRAIATAPFIQQNGSDVATQQGQKSSVNLVQIKSVRYWRALKLFSKQELQHFEYLPLTQLIKPEW